MRSRNKQLAGSLIKGYESKLFQLATTFRRAIMQRKPETLCVTLQNFPFGACGDASLLLAKYLEYNKCGEFQYVLGNRNGYSHAWLEQHRLIIDITADQFDDQHTPVIVSFNHHWHNSFHIEFTARANYKQYDAHTCAILEKTYLKIIANI